MYGNFLEARNSMSLPSEERDLFKLTDHYNKAIKDFNGDTKVKDYLIWDYELMSCRARPLDINNPRTYSRLVSMFEWEDGQKWPDINLFENERADFYGFCVDNTKNISMVVRYLDYLVDHGNTKDKYSYAKRLVDLLMPLCDVYSGNYFGFYLDISRVVDIIMRFNFSGEISVVEDKLNDVIASAMSKREYSWISRLSSLLHYLSYQHKQKQIKQSSIDQIIHYLSQIMEQYADERNLEIFVNASLELIKWYKAEKFSDDDINKVLIGIGEAYEVESCYQGGRKEKSHFVKAHFLEKAVQHYINIGENSRIPKLKLEIKEAYKQAGKAEIKEVSTGFDISTETINAEIDKFRSDNIEESLQLLSRTNYFLPIKDNIIQVTREIDKEAVLTKLLNVQFVYGDRKVFQSESEEETFKVNFYRTYDLELQIKFGVFYDAVWEALLKNGLRANHAIDRITSWQYMNNDSRFIVEQGVLRMFDEDYISAIHILVPRFENCFREFFECGGYPTTSIKSKTVQHEQNFNDFIRNDFVKSNICDDLLFFISFVMLDDLGYNLRNNVAHGLSTLEQFNRVTALIVLYLFFLLTNLEWTSSNTV